MVSIYELWVWTILIIRLFIIFFVCFVKLTDTVALEIRTIINPGPPLLGQLTWLALDEDQVARSRRVEQLIALRGL